MDANTATQIVTVALAVLAIIWHQQRTIDKLRTDFERANDRLRGDFGRAVDKLRDRLDGVEQRLARIEGFLGIGMPKSTEPDAPGAPWGPDRPEPE